MQVQMTERDKRLIVILTIVVLIVGFGWWGIRPAIRDNAELKEELEEQEDLRVINEQKLSKLLMYEAEADSYAELINEEKKHFFPLMTSSEIDRYFTNMILDSGMESYDLNMRIGSAPVKVEPYAHSALARLVEEAREGEKGGEKTESDPFEYESGPAFNSEVYGVDVALRLAGDMMTLKWFIEDLSDSENLLLIRNCVWTTENIMNRVQEDPGDGEEDIPLMSSRTVLNINLTLYMCDRSAAEEEE